ncbi:protein FAM8A1 isoform X2 [Chiloscyllium plagiosum]|uniref:protein FAM8A1 isoform X2 n=1 Tax=Chiloscyllium plagiosum TaxID=36176 RepID=UPI001CB7C277|nr:protein FAM8A1 isoform X2 [Chiloscyllium plagiosum]
MAECSGPDRHRDRGGSCSFTNNPAGKSQGAPGTTVGAGEYCRKVQEWLWQYYSYVQWQSWLMMMAPLPPYYPFVSGGARQSEGEAAAAPTPGVNNPFPLYLGVPTVSPTPGEQPQQREVATASASGVRLPATNAQQQAANVHPRGREYTIPSLMHRFLAEMVDFLILFLLKAIVVLTVMHICGIKDLSKFALNYIIEEIDEDTSLEDLQKMMAVALMYRLLVCFYEIVCLWGVGGATPGKFLLGLRVVSCDSSVLVAPNRVLVIPAQNVSISSNLMVEDSVTQRRHIQ